MLHRLSVITLTLGLLSACASTPSPAPAQSSAARPAAGQSLSSTPVPNSVSAHSRCRSGAADHLLNRAGSAEVLEQARQQAGAQRARLLGEGDPMTMDYDSQRLNLYLDGQGRIKLITCG